MAMVSFGHPVHRQDAKEKPQQTQKNKSYRNYEWTNNAPTAGDRVSTLKELK